MHYRNVLKFSGRQIWANSAESRSDCSLSRVYTVCNSLCIFWMHYSKQKLSCSTFRVVTANFRVSERRIFTVSLKRYACGWNFLEQWNNMSHDTTKPKKWVCAQWSLRSAMGIRPVWSKYSRCAQWVAKDPRFLHADSEDSDQTGRMQADLSLRSAHTHFVGFVMSRLI